MRSASIKRTVVLLPPGLAECLEGSLNPVSALRRLEPLNWYLLSAG